MTDTVFLFILGSISIVSLIITTIFVSINDKRFDSEESIMFILLSTILWPVYILILIAYLVYKVSSSFKFAINHNDCCNKCACGRMKE
jgi:hypothetical protein